jgi:hypothetical protein
MSSYYSLISLKSILKNVHFLFFIILLMFFVPLNAGAGSIQNASESPDYAIADRHALAAPVSAERDMRRLSSYLTDAFEENEAYQARAIYRWITDRIRYDTGTYFDGTATAEGTRPEVVLQRRSALCGGYAELFRYLATEAGLEAVTINGHSKGYGFSPQKTRRQGIAANHAWNAVRIDGHWKLLDATWGSGYIDGESLGFTKRFEEHYFFTDPDAFIFNHFPDDPQWQLLEQPVSESEYLNMAWVRPAFFHHGLSLNSHQQQHIETAGPLVIELGVPESSIISARLRKDEREPDQQALLVHHQSNQAFIELTPPDRGTYELIVFVRDAELTGQAYPQAMSYTIDSRRRINHPGYPITYGKYTEQRSRLEEPRIYQLESESTQHFSMHVPGAIEISVINEGQWTALQGNGNHFFGDVSLMRGTVQVAGRFSNSEEGRYEVLLEYEVR